MTADRIAEFDLAGLDAGAIWAALDQAVEQDEASVVLLHVDGARLDDPHQFWGLELYPVPIVASISKEALEGVFPLAMGADIRVAAEGARIGPVTEGFGDACWDRLAFLVGGKHAVAIYDDAWWPAQLAFERGLVTALARPGAARDEARRIAETVASRGPIATRLAKEAIWRGLPQHLEQALRFETDLTLLLQTTKDRAEGVAAFLEKRGPRFTGE